MIRSVGLPHKSVIQRVVPVVACVAATWSILILMMFLNFDLAHGCHRTRAAVVVHCLFALVGELARAGGAGGGVVFAATRAKTALTSAHIRPR